MEISKRAFLGGALSSGLLASLTGCARTTPLWYRRFCQGRVRRNVYSLLAQNPNHPVLQTYAAGVAAMKALPSSNPTSWLYQANIHGTNISPSLWPPGAPWSTCPHGSNFFIAWHRLYLFFFEKIIAHKTNVPGFALPYWDYSQPGSGAIPPPFRVTTSPLYEAVRGPGVNAGGSLTSATTSAAVALARPNYLGFLQFHSRVEGQPHNAVHSALGGKMGAPSTAAQDPIFWLHHAHTDRLQERWLRNAPGHNLNTATSNSTWMAKTYTFAQPNGALVTLTGAQTVSTLTAPLDYIYDDDVSPICNAVLLESPVVSTERIARSDDRAFLAGLVARAEARSRGIDLTRQRRVQVPLGDATRRALSGPAAGVRYLLLLNDATARFSPDVIFAVHVGESEVPDHVESPSFAGFVSFFGRLAGDLQHGGDNEHLPPPVMAFDITDQLGPDALRRRLVAERELTVLFTPVGVEDPRGGGRAPEPAAGSMPTIGEAMVVAVGESELR